MLDRGFRPFFALAALLALLAVPLWTWTFVSGAPLTLALTPRDWHVHEMLFGYGQAVLAGFLLTAIPNWTGRAPVAGAALAVLVATWLAGRAALLVPGIAPPLAAAVTAAFPLALATLCWYQILASGNRRNLPVCVLVSAFTLSDIGFLASHAVDWDPGWSVRAGLSSLLLLIAFIAGRVVPAFSRNWMKSRGMVDLPAQFDTFDGISLGAVTVALVCWVALPASPISAWLLLAAAVTHAVRLARWRGWRSFPEPLVLVMHIAYAWLVVGLALLAWALLELGGVSVSSAIHALSAGTVGSMTLAIMTRAILGHSAHALHAGPGTVLIYALVSAGAVLRVIAPVWPEHYAGLLGLSAGLWSGAFALFLFLYGPLLLSSPDPEH